MDWPRPSRTDGKRSAGFRPAPEWRHSRKRQDVMTIKLGNKAPKLSGVTQSGDTLKLVDLR
ncbi:MAG: hypothetical protein ACREPF_09450, partial [Rhodanobacteraceae bacterium]